jgi:hypothetical protein
VIDLLLGSFSGQTRLLQSGLSLLSHGLSSRAIELG